MSTTLIPEAAVRESQASYAVYLYSRDEYHVMYEIRFNSTYPNRKTVSPVKLGNINTTLSDMLKTSLSTNKIYLRFLARCSRYQWHQLDITACNQIHTSRGFSAIVSRARIAYSNPSTRLQFAWSQNGCATNSYPSCRIFRSKFAICVSRLCKWSGN